MTRHAGSNSRHESGRGHVTGSAIYTDDAVGRHPGVLHAWPVLAPHAHATVGTLDTAPALDEPGVVTVLTHADVPGEGDTGANRHDEPLFPTEVMFFNQPIAWVLGASVDAARQGAARVTATYAPLPAILTIEEAIAAESYLTTPLRITNGDMSSLDASALRLDGELRIGGQEHFYLETQSAIASLDDSGGVFVESSTQHPAETRKWSHACSGCTGTRSPLNACAWVARSAARRSRPTHGPQLPPSARGRRGGPCACV